MSLLIVALLRHAVNKYPAMPVVLFVLIAVNTLILWKVFSLNRIYSWHLKALWILGALAAIDFPLQVASCIRKPDLQSVVLAVVWFWWITYAWAGVRRLSEPRQ